MGGGDLNSKKSWHPNTMKNQERVWKAEQIAAEEKKRILELQQERAQERDRHELNELARKNTPTTNSDNRLDWMYNKPDKQVQHEDYLLGKAIDKSFEQGDKAEQNEIPAVARRVVGSSMLASTSDVQVDLARKIREDPLLLVKERERAARAALLNNPVQRKRLAELLRQEQEQKKAQKKKKKTKKADKDLDNILAAKLNALSSSKVDLAKLLESDDSSDDSSDDEKSKKKKKKKKKHKSKDKGKDEEKGDRKKHKKRKQSESDNEESSQDRKSRKNSSKRKSSVSEDESSPKKKHKKHHKSSKHNDSDEESCDLNVKQPHYSKHTKYDSDVDYDKKQEKKYSKERKNSIVDDDYKREKNILSQKHQEHTSTTKSFNHERSKDKNERTYYHKNIKEDRKINRKVGLSEEEKAAKLAEMAAAGAEREVQRGRRVAAQLAENSAAEKSVMSRASSRNEARALPDSLESRIHSNRHYIQRDQRHMNENFARR